MPKELKILLIFIAGFLLNFVLSCGCDIDEAFADFNTLSIENVDNSGHRPVVSASDTMHSEAVAFRIIIADTTSMLYVENNQRTNLGFKQANAWQCACWIKYYANQEIRNIQITTLYPLSGEIHANSDVTHLFLAIDPRGLWRNNLYIEIDEIYEAINGNSYCDERPREHFHVALRIKAEHDVAQFLIKVELSDHRTFSETTNLIHLIN
jgi:hypothetical protein